LASVWNNQRDRAGRVGQQSMTVKKRVTCAVAAGALFLNSCALLPTDGPLAAKLVEADDSSNVSEFEIVEIQPSTIKALQTAARTSFAGLFGNGAPPPVQRIGVGDVVSVTIWEAAGGGLYTGSEGANTGVGSRSTVLPPQTVDREGSISIPYGGRVRATGLSPAEVAHGVEMGLKGNAINPQAIVSVSQAASTAATVVGNVTGGGSILLNVKGDRLLEVIAKAGGVKSPTVETFIRLTRGSKTAIERLSNILEHPSENVFIRPADSIYVFSTPQTFTALGAVTHSGELSIDRENFTLAQALGTAGGLIDTQADARGVFLFRFERREVVQAIRRDSPLLSTQVLVPVIYRLQMTGPDSYFSAKAFPVQPEDLIYVSNAPSVEFMKFVVIARAVASTARLAQAANPIAIP
jgi:polysaccharide biosynthesis/export protein